MNEKELGNPTDERRITDPLILEAFKKWDADESNPVGVPDNWSHYECTFEAGFRAGWEQANINIAYTSDGRATRPADKWKDRALETPTQPDLYLIKLYNGSYAVRYMGDEADYRRRDFSHWQPITPVPTEEQTQ